MLTTRPNLQRAVAVAACSSASNKLPWTRSVSGRLHGLHGSQARPASFPSKHSMGMPRGQKSSLFSGSLGWTGWQLHAATPDSMASGVPTEPSSSSPAAPSEPPSPPTPTERNESPGAVARKKAGKLRLDEACVKLYPEYSRKLVQSLILQGKVFVNGQQLSKAGQAIRSDAKVEIIADVPKYVCRGGLKLEAALKEFNIDVTGLVALDSGQSTGGFTDCLLQHGAAQVVGIDCGYNQLHERMRQHERVLAIEKFNLRHLTPADIAPHKIDIATLDLSFISVLKVLPAVVSVLKAEAQMVILIKPQFEAGRSQVGTGGIVKDPKVHKEVINTVTAGVEAMGFKRVGLMESPIRGDKGGNLEFLGHFIRVDPNVIIPRPHELMPDDEPDSAPA